MVSTPRQAPSLGYWRGLGFFGMANRLGLWEMVSCGMGTRTYEASIVYRDGKEVGNKILGEVPVTGKPMHFGNRLPWEGRSEWFNGTLDEIGFWNRPLSEGKSKRSWKTV